MVKRRVCKGMNYLSQSIVSTPYGIVSNGLTASQVNTMLAFRNTNRIGGVRRINKDDLVDAFNYAVAESLKEFEQPMNVTEL